MASKREVSIIIKAIDRASRVMRSITNAATKDFTNIGNAARQAATSIGLIGAALSLSLGLAINTTADFQQSMANTQSVIGATTDELGQLTKAAREMGKVSVFSASQAADAMFFLASAGLNTEKVIDALGGTMDLAAATMADLSFTTETVVSTLAAFGLEAQESDRVANVFAATISGSQATMERLATAMSFVAPVARSVNLSLEETSSLLGRLFTSGIGASTAGTALRMAFSKLLKPTDEAKAALGRLKVVVQTSDGNIRNFVEIIRDLERSGLTAADAMTIFGVRAGPALLTLVNQGASAIDNLTKKITGTNKAAEMAALQISTFKGQMKLLKSAAQELQIVIGTQLLPMLTDLVIKVTSITTKIAEWTKEHQTLTKVLGTSAVAMAGVTTALSAIGFAIFGITQAIGPLQKGVGLISKAFFALGNTTLILKVRLALLGKGIVGLAGVIGGGILAGLAVFASALALVKHEADKTKKAILQNTEEIKRQNSNVQGIKDALALYETALKQVRDAQDKGAKSVSLLGTALKDADGNIGGLDASILPVNDQIIRLREKIAELNSQLKIAGGDIFDVNSRLSEAPAIIQAMFSPLEKLGSILENVGKKSIEPVVLTDEQKKLLEALAIEQQRLTLSTTEFEIKEIERAAEAQIKVAAGNGDIILQIEKVRDAQIAALRKTALDEAKQAALEERNVVVAAQEAETQARFEAGQRFLAGQEELKRKTEAAIEAEKRARFEAGQRFLAGQEELKQKTEAANAADQKARADAHKRFLDGQAVIDEGLEATKAKREEERQVRLATIQELAQREMAANEELQAQLNSLREAATQREQVRIARMQQSYAGFIKSAISLGRQFFSSQDEGWLRATAATVRFITRVVSGFLRQKSLEKSKQAEEAKTAAQFHLQHGAKMLALAAEFALMGDLVRAGAALAAAGKDAAQAAVFTTQAVVLETEAAGLMVAATAVEVAGAIAAGGLDLAADKVRRNAKEQEELARTTERRLDTELRLKQQILEMEGRTTEAKRLGIEDEASQLREMGINENLIRRFESLSIADTQGNGNVAVETGGSPAGAIGGSGVIAPARTVLHQTNTFIGIVEAENQDALREFARQLLPLLEDLQDLETTA